MPPRSEEDLPRIPGVEILSLISTGGMGDVLLARRLGAHGFEKLIAVKTIRPELARSKDIRAMFLDEARLVAQLDHPAITHVYDFGEEDGMLYLTMEYVPGLSFGELMKKLGRVPPLVATELVAKVLRGLHAAHELTDLTGRSLGVVHRDVSPDNLILTFDGRVKILDFGIALVRDRETPQTQLGSLKGKPAYMAPERLRGEPVDRRTDVYSAAVVLHELLTGEKLFSRGSMIATALAVESESVAKPSDRIGDLPDRLDEVVMRGLARDPDKRYPDAKTMAAALDDIVRVEEGAPPIEDFVTNELDAERTKHRLDLQTILDEYEPLRSIPPSARSTINLPPNQASISPLADATTLVPVRDSFEVPIPTAASSGGLKRAVFLAVLIVLIPLGIVGFLVSKDTSSDVVDVVAVPPDPEPPPPTAVEVIIPDDGPKFVADEVEVEKRPVKRRVKKRPKQKRAKPNREAEAKPEGTGFLTLGADPYARIRIDGEEVGVTPIVNMEVSAGKHVVEFLRPDSGELIEIKKVTLKDGQKKRLTVADE